MATDDEAARKARAERLRKQVDELKHKGKAPEEPETEPTGGKSPRDLIHDKMRELDRDKSKE